MDITDAAETGKVISCLNPDAVIHCAARYLGSRKGRKTGDIGGAR